ncbi:protein yippee-like isoform X1 [Solanum tuberosum]|nr:PREDICTED: protein yippee-like isoform X1 [Solanum tuberosum]
MLLFGNWLDCTMILFEIGNLDCTLILSGVDYLYTTSGMYPNSALHPFLQSFQCRHGKAYLFDKVVNVTLGEKEERMMLTGIHTVVDIFCVGCGSIVGWKYEAAQEKDQKYKEGRFILERFKILGPDGSNYSILQDAQLGGSDTDEP